MKFRHLFIHSAVLLLIASSCGQIEDHDEHDAEAEILPEDIIELRDDQIKLADISFGKIEMRSLGNPIRVNGVISVAPGSFATVCMPLGGFVKSTSLVPGNSIKK